MTERTGYIYRRANAPLEVLRELLASARHGWSWTSADLFDASRGDNLLLGAEGRAGDGAREIRWRRNPDAGPEEQRKGDGGEGYDLLVLALVEQDLVGFTLLLAGDAPWRTRPIAYRLYRMPTASDQPDNTPAATAFVAPDGSIQFVALIGAAERNEL